LKEENEMAKRGDSPIVEAMQVQKELELRARLTLLNAQAGILACKRAAMLTENSATDKPTFRKDSFAKLAESYEQIIAGAEIIIGELKP
jgi:hypothetical protein